MEHPVYVKIILINKEIYWNSEPVHVHRNENVLFLSRSLLDLFKNTSLRLPSIYLIRELRSFLRAGRSDKIP